MERGKGLHGEDRNSDEEKKHESVMTSRRRTVLLLPPSAPRDGRPTSAAPVIQGPLLYSARRCAHALPGHGLLDDGRRRAHKPTAALRRKQHQWKGELSDRELKGNACNTFFSPFVYYFLTSQLIVFLPFHFSVLSDGGQSGP